MEPILISNIIRGEPLPPRARVFIAELPIGITNEDIANMFKQYGSILNIASIDKVLYGRKINTGDRVVTFSSINGAIPSYVHVRGWRTFVKYRGQVLICKICGDSGHLAKNGSKNRRNAEPQKHMNSQQERKPDKKPDEDQGKLVNMETESSQTAKEPKSTPILQESLEELGSEMSEGDELLPSPLVFQDKKEEFFPPPPVLDENGLGQDNQIEAKRSRQVTNKFCCFVNGPNCPLHRGMDSHSDVECSTASLKQTNKKKSQVLRTVSIVGLLSGKAKTRGSNATSSRS